MLKTIIIEDEIASHQLLSQIIKNYCPNLEFKGIASSFEESKDLIEKVKPDLIFMDIELEDTNAFELLDEIKHKNFRIIFTTAHEEHALEAFKYEAIDYLLKPYSPSDVIKAINKIHTKYFFEAPTSFDTGKLCIATSEGILIFNLSDIIRLEANGSYCNLHLVCGQKCMASKTLKDIESQLPSNNFFRTHASHLININHIKQYKIEDGGQAILSNNDAIPVSRRKKAAFLSLLTQG